jgi:HPr kinase/phosphorylase
MELQVWDEGRFYDRLGLQEEKIEILGVPITYVLMPVRPGRNLAIIIEAAARNLSLKRMGYHAAKDLTRRVFSTSQDLMDE